MSDHYTFSDAPEKWDTLYRLIGVIAHESSFAHWLVFEMFRIALKMDREEASGLYYALRADSGQRDLTVSVLEDRLAAPEYSELLARVKKTFTELGKASGRRNGFIHTPWAMRYSSLEFVASHGAKLHPKLLPTDIIGQAEKLVKDLYAVSHDLMALCDEIEQLPLFQKSS